MGKVLVVNDDMSVLSGDRRRLAGAGFRVREANDIYSANDILYENEVDAVLVETSTAGGRLFADVVRRLHPGLPVILVGSFPADAARGSGTQHDRRAGTADLLGKLFTAIGRRRNQRAAVAGGGAEDALEDPP